MRRLFPALFCSLVFSSVAAAAPGAVHCAHLLDVRSGEIRTDQTIVFAADGTITNVGPAKSAVIPPNATAIEVAGTIGRRRIRCAGPGRFPRCFGAA